MTGSTLGQEFFKIGGTMNTKNWLKGYKVVRRHNKKLYSALIGYMLFNCSLVSTRYITGHPVSRRDADGALAVFRNKADAVRFAKRHSFEFIRSLVVYECEYLPSRCTSLFQKNRRKVSVTPTGTAYANTVKITKRIK